MRRLFRYLEPTFFSGLIEDPCLIVRDRPIHRGIMVDCGSIHHLAKRELKPIQAIFVSHAHMDHFMGFDAFLRQVHASPRTVEIFGPPGFASRVAARLSGYDWNLCEPYWCTFQVHEVHQEIIRSYVFSGPSGFRSQETGERPREGRVIYRHNHLEVAAELLDHGIPVLAFRVSERNVFALDERRLAALGLVPGEWLKELKKRFYAGWPESGPLQVLLRDGETVTKGGVEDAAALYQKIRSEFQSPSIGYLTDIGFSPGNLAIVERFLKGVSLLIGECAFLREDMHKARASRHLCTDDVNALLEVVLPRYFLPIHLSKTYLGRSEELYSELAPPSGTTILRLPEHVTHRPMYACEVTQLCSKEA